MQIGVRHNEGTAFGLARPRSAAAERRSPRATSAFDAAPISWAASVREPMDTANRFDHKTVDFVAPDLTGSVYLHHPRPLDPVP